MGTDPAPDPERQDRPARVRLIAACRDRVRPAGCTLAVVATLAVASQQAGPARAEDPAPARPMSAIDWLSSSVGPSSAGSSGASAPQQPGTPRQGSVQILGRASSAVLPPVPGETPVTPVIRTETISEISLDHPPPNAVGLVSAPRTGVPIDFWGATPEADLAASVRKERLDTLPAIQSFLMQILLAELEPPLTPSAEGRNVLFLARVDRLLDMGALDQAGALLDQADPDDPEVFRRRFDVALLLGREDGACKIMTETPAVAPSFPARIFCLARRGDWPAAALSLDTGRALGQIDPEMAELLARFLDPELTEESPELPPPARPTPLVFRMMEAIGQPIATATLPVAFAQADLDANHGRKAEIEAAERLTRSGVLDPNRLLGLYTGQRASASGGVWDRVTLVSTFDKALSAGNAARVGQLLPALWDEMQAQELEPAMAAMFAERLKGLALDDDAAAIVFRLGLLTPDFAAVAGTHRPADADEALLAGIARGDTSACPAQDRMGLMLKTVFDARPKAIPARYAGLLPDRLGEAVLDAIDDVTEGARGDLRRVGDGLTLLRATGFETVARRAALELVVLERNG